MGFLFALLAAIFASSSNYCLRRSMDNRGSARAFLVVQSTFSFFVMILLNPLRMHDFVWNNRVATLGLFGGLILGLLLWGIGKSLEKGPPALTLAVINASSIMPALVLFLFFGIHYGHSYTLWNGFGSMIVILGLFWAGHTSIKNEKWRSWTFFSTMSFVLHALFMIYLSWWAMVLTSSLPLGPLLPFHIETAHVHWFMPALFFIAALFQLGVYLTQEKSMIKGSEFIYGVFGGLANGMCAFFLVKAPQVASGWQNAMLFPLYSVSGIVFCNIWSQLVYKEKVNWKANTICIAGLIIGTVIVD